MEWLVFVFWLLVLIGPLVFAHEAGHFLFAKLFRVKVIVFSLGFGTPVRIGNWKLSKKIGETEYRIAWFPLGGFVRMLGDDPGEEVSAEEKVNSFSEKSAWKRFFIISGGPLFSVLLAIPIFFVFHLMLSFAPAPIVGMVISGSPAAEAGIQPGDTIINVDGLGVKTWEEIDSGIQKAEGEQVKLSVVRGDMTMSFRLDPIKIQDQSGLELFQNWEVGIRHNSQGDTIGVVSQEAPAARAGLKSWDRVISLGGIPVHGWWEMKKLMQGNGKHLLPVTAVRMKGAEIGELTFQVPQMVETFILPETADQAPEGAWTTSAAYTGMEAVDLYIQSVSKGFPAEKHGVKSGDKIVSVSGRPIHGWEEFSRLMHDASDDVLSVTIRHEGKLRKIEFVPKTITQTNEFRQKTEKPGLGVMYRPNIKGGSYITRPNRLTNAIRMAFMETIGAMERQVEGLAAVFKGKIKPTDAIGGPLMIADLAKKSAERGWRQFVAMMAFLSVFLGLLNLLPIPILDGGHIAFILVEAVLRKPVSMKVRLVASYVGLFLLVSLMVFAFTNDIHRYWFN